VRVLIEMKLLSLLKRRTLYEKVRSGWCCRVTGVEVLFTVNTRAQSSSLIIRPRRYFILCQFMYRKSVDWICVEFELKNDSPRGDNSRKMSG